MQTTIYFVRHATPLRAKDNGYTDATFPLSDKGLADTALVTHFLRDKNITAVLSSPFKRACDTVAPFAKEAGLPIHIIEDFRERAVGDEWVEDFRAFSTRQWADENYKLIGGESLKEVQSRNIAALHKVLKAYPAQSLAVGTHGTALSLIMQHFDPTALNYEEWKAMPMPWVVKMKFENDIYVGIEKINLFDQKKVVTVCFPYDSFKEYYASVICARRVSSLGTWEWLFVRHKKRAWEIPGGRIEAGETPLEAAKRELKEETGAVKFHITPAFDFSFHPPNPDPKIYYQAGQVFLADIETMEALSPESEIAEVRAFTALPTEEMSFNIPHPIIFNAMLAWLEKNTPEEYWDLLDENRNPLGITHRRGLPKPKGTYHMVVNAWVVNNKNEVLCTRRALTKLGAPGKWEVTAGSANAGEDSLTAALRELKEETGIIVPPECSTLVHTARSTSAFWDIWLFRYDFEMAQVVLLEGETMDARALSVDEITDMIKKGMFTDGFDETLAIVSRLIK